MFSKRLLQVVAAGVLVLMAADPASAQVEIGVDAGLTSTRIDGSDLAVVQTDIPVQRQTTLQVGTDLVFHVGRNSFAPQLYVAGGPSILRTDFGAGEETQLGVGGDVGLKVPVGGWMALRMGVGYTRWLESDTLLGADEVGAFFGFSVFTH